MSSVVLLAALGAAAIAMTSGAFGVGVARMLWAEDLHQARRIDEIRSRTEGHLRTLIATQERTIGTLNDTIGIQKRRLGEAP